MNEGGALALHLTNRFLNLEPPVGDVAAALGLRCAARHHEVTHPSPEAVSTRWVVVAREGSPPLQQLLRDARWHPVAGRPEVRVWTDDYSNILRALSGRP